MESDVGLMNLALGEAATRPEIREKEHADADI